MDNCNWDKHRETKVLHKNGLLVKYTKLEQNED